jgi:hypothetical protein
MHGVYKACGAALVSTMDHHQDIAVGIILDPVAVIGIYNTPATSKSIKDNFR